MTGLLPENEGRVITGEMRLDVDVFQKDATSIYNLALKNAQDIATAYNNALVKIPHLKVSEFKAQLADINSALKTSATEAQTVATTYASNLVKSIKGGVRVDSNIFKVEKKDVRDYARTALSGFSDSLAKSVKGVVEIDEDAFSISTKGIKNVVGNLTALFTEQAREKLRGKIKLDYSIFSVSTRGLEKAAKEAAGDFVDKFSEKTVGKVKLQSIDPEGDKAKVVRVDVEEDGTTEIINKLDQVDKKIDQVVDGLKELGQGLDNTSEKAKKAGDKAKTLAKKLTESEIATRNLQAAMSNARITLLAISAATGLFIRSGLKAADNLRMLEVRYQALTGSQEDAVRMMERVASAARNMSLPVRESQNAFVGLIPTIRQVNGSVEEYINLTARLATLNQDERGGIGGAIFSIREAVVSGGTDLVSIVDRFNLSRKTLRDAIKETGNFAVALDKVLKVQGATDEVVKANAESLSGLVALIRDDATQVLETAFVPILGKVRDGLKDVRSFIQGLSEDDIQLVTTITLVVAALAGGALAIDQFATGVGRVIDLYKAFGKSITTTVLPNIAKAVTATKAWIVAHTALLTSLAVGVGAVAVGAYAGIKIMNAHGRATGNEYQENLDTGDIWNTLKQIGFLLFYFETEIMEKLIFVMMLPLAPFLTFSNTLDLIVNVVKLGTLELKLAFLRLGEWIDDFLPGNPVEDAGNWVSRGIEELEHKVVGTFTGIYDLASRKLYEGVQSSSALSRIINLSEPEPITPAITPEDERKKYSIDDDLRETEALRDATRKDVEGGVSVLSGDVESLWETVSGVTKQSQQMMLDFLGYGQKAAFASWDAAEASKRAEEAWETLQARAIDRYNRFMGILYDEFSTDIDRRIGMYQDVQKLIKDGDQDALEGRVSGLELEREAIMSVIPELELAAEYSNDAAKKLDELRQRLFEIAGEIPALLEALEAVTSNEIKAAYAEYDQAVSDAVDVWRTALDDINEEEKKALDDLITQDTKANAKFTQARLKANEAYHKAVVTAEEAFAKRMTDIHRNYIRAVTLAASSLDAAGVMAAIQSRMDGERGAEEDLQNSKTSALEAREESRKAAETELEDLRNDLDTRRQEILDDMRTRRDDAQLAYSESRRIAVSALNTELDTIMTYFNRRKADLALFLEQENALIAEKQKDRQMSYLGTVFSPNATEMGAFMSGRYGNNPLYRAMASLQTDLGMVTAQGYQNWMARPISTGLTGSNITININGSGLNPDAIAREVNKHIIKLTASP